MSPRVALCHYGAIGSLIALIFLCLVWEGWLAHSALVFKVLPLLAPLFGILRGRRYTYQWASMLILFYFMEGVVRVLTDTGLSAFLAGLETVLSLTFFLSVIFYARFTRAQAPVETGSG